VRHGLLVGLLAAVAAVLAGRRLLGGDTSRPAPAAHRYLLEREQLVPAPPDEAFRFFAEPENLARMMPDGVHFRILSVDGTPMRAGTRIEYQIRLQGVPHRWLAEIVAFEPPRRFVDLQLRGPYRYWRHEHAFEPAGGGTLVRDRVDYQLPLGALGRLAHPFVARQLQRIFDERGDAIARCFAR
jgi:ligand-binding SRPBCC domain-containing protein